MLPKLFLNQNLPLFMSKQIEVGEGRTVVNVIRTQVMLQTPVLQAYEIIAPYLGYGFDAREPRIEPIVGQIGDLPSGDRLFPLIKFLSVDAKSHSYTSADRSD